MILDILFRIVNHGPTLHGHGGGYGHTREHSFSGPRETVHRVHGNLIGQLLAVVHLFHVTGRGRHVLLGLFAKLFEFDQNGGQKARDILGKLVRAKCFIGDPGNIGVPLIHDERRITQVVGNHDGRVQALEIEGRDRSIVRTGLGLQDRRAFVLFRRRLAPPNRGNHKPNLPRLSRHLTKHLDLLTPLGQVRYGNPRRLGHFQKIQEVTELIHQHVGQDGIFDTVVGNLAEFIGVALFKTPEHFLGRHVKFSVAQKCLGYKIEAIRIQLVFALHVVKHVKHVSPGHRKKFQGVVAQGAR